MRHSTSIAYRPDIDGLRAVAVSSVVVFHAWANWAPGGFVGVDIFFVISGFLIGSIILNEIEAGRFTLLWFYERRVRRIFPALFTVLLVTLAAAFVLYMPEELVNVAESFNATLLFVSNFHFYKETGYFEVARELQPLLHTWSLAVEEQYYFGFPLLMIALARLGRQRIALILAAIAALSLAADVIAVYVAPAAAFYWTPFRVWELLAGAILATGVIKPAASAPVREAVSAAGLCAILAAVFGYTSDTDFPGAAALPPVLGSAAIIYAATGAPTLVSRALSLRPIVFVGLISYSLYLWHWPLLTLTEYYLLRDLTLAEALGLVLVAVVAATLTWRFVERPFLRPRPRVPRRLLFGGALGLSLAMASATSAIITLKGIPSRLPASAGTYLTAERKRWRERHQCNLKIPGRDLVAAACRLGVASDTAPRFVLWGDSHAGSMFPGIDAVARRRGWQGTSTIDFGCAPILGLPPVRAGRKCDEFNRRALDYITSTRPAIVILDGRWGLYDNAYQKLNVSAKGTASFADLFEQTVRRLQGVTGEVAIIGPTPEFAFDVQSVVGRAMAWNRPLPAPTQAAAFYDLQNDVLGALRKLDTLPRVRIIYPHEILCDGQKCIFEQGGKPLFIDDDHVSPAGAEAVEPALEEIFAKDEKQ